MILPTKWPVVPGFMELLHSLFLQMYLQETINNFFILSLSYLDILNRYWETRMSTQAEELEDIFYELLTPILPIASLYKFDM